MALSATTELTLQGSQIVTGTALLPIFINI